MRSRGGGRLYSQEVARATTSSPTFYAPTMISGGRFVDGAVLANNPSMIALCEAKTLWTGVHVEVMVATTAADSATSVFT
jgi:patatin-like phospholipase/acyl hydrolase